MAKKNNEESIGCLAIIFGLVILSWIAQNLLGVIGILLIVLAIYFRQYNRRINAVLFWSVFSIGVLITGVWFN